MDTIQLTENELFEIVGRCHIEIFVKDKELAALRGQFEKIKPTLIESEANKTKNVALDSSNKALAEKNISLDQALTQARKEREELRLALTSEKQRSDEAQRIIDAQKAELDVSNKALNAVQNAGKKGKR